MSLRGSLQALKDAGFEVPDNAITFARDKELSESDIAAVFLCKCGHEYKSPLPLTHYEHGCGKQAKQTWKRG